MENSAFATRSLSAQESRVVLSLIEHGRRAVERQEVIDRLDVGPNAADHVIRSLCRKGWFERASWGRYLLIPPETGPDAIGESNVLALASQIAIPYYFGYSTAAKYLGLTTQYRHIVRVVSPVRRRNRRILNSEIRLVNPVRRKFFGFGPIDVFGYKVMMSDREKTAIDCIDRPRLAGGEGEVALIFAVACRSIDWQKSIKYLEKMESKTLARRVGWLTEHVGAELPDDVRERLRTLAGGDGTSFFGPKQQKNSVIGYLKKWKLFVNVSKSELQESIGIGHPTKFKQKMRNVDKTRVLSGKRFCDAPRAAADAVTGDMNGRARASAARNR